MRNQLLQFQSIIGGVLSYTWPNMCMRAMATSILYLKAISSVRNGTVLRHTLPMLNGIFSACKTIAMKFEEEKTTLRRQYRRMRSGRWSHGRLVPVDWL